MRSSATGLILSILVLWAGAQEVAAQTITEAVADWDRLTSVRDSLLEERQRLSADVDGISRHIDSLKTSAGESRASGPLEAALRRSLGFVERLEHLDSRLVRVQRALLDQSAQLRSLYDREIARLARRLDGSPGQATLERLARLRAEREALPRAVDPSRESTRTDLLSIGDADGPEEIRQKADLMEDIASRLAIEARAVGDRLARLDEERRLRGRGSAFTREISLFDENLPLGRSISPMGSPSVPEGDPKAADEAQESLAGGGRFGDNQSGALAPEAPVEAEMLAGKEISPVGSDAAPGDLGADDLQQEIARLRSRDVLLRSRMAALTRQAAEFRERIREMLEGGR